MYLNKVILIGNLTRDPELKALPSGIKVASFSLATNKVWRDKEGNKQESVEFHNVVVFGKQAENVAQYMKKGNSLLVEGRIQTRSWENKEGKKQYKTEIVGEMVQFGNSPKRDGEVDEKKVETKNDKSELDKEFPDDDIDPADIPF